MAREERVEHPRHYNSRKDGLECIDVIRHYTCDVANAQKYLWRAGLKQEDGKDAREKEIEDLHKALWYIDDYVVNCGDETQAVVTRPHMRSLVHHATGYTVSQICGAYHRDVAKAMEMLLMVGLVSHDGIVRIQNWEKMLAAATKCIQHRILDLEAELKNAQ